MEASRELNSRRVEEARRRGRRWNCIVGRDIDRNLLARMIIEEMDHSYRRFESGRVTELLGEARRLCSTLGRKVRVTTTEGRFMCEALDLGDDGQLMARLNNGAVIPLYGADVVHLR